MECFVQNLSLNLSNESEGIIELNQKNIKKNWEKYFKNKIEK